MDMSTVKQPASALSSPRFCNTGTFMRMSKVDSAQGLDFVIAGAPFDTASSFRSGSRFGPQAIRAISAMMKPNNVILQVNIMESLKGGDIGDFNITPGYIHPSYKAIEEGVAGILQENAIPIVLGGDHSITLPELRAVAKRHGPVALLHFDAHSDTGDDFFGKPYNHGTTFHWAIEEGLILPEQSTQAGIRGPLYSRSSLDYAKGKGMRVISGWELHDIGVDETIRIMRERIRPGTPVFVTFDIDFLDAAYAPGTGTPEIGGFTTHEALKLILGVCPGQRLVGMDLVEVLPDTDSAGITSFAAAGIMHAFLACLAANKKHNPS